MKRYAQGLSVLPILSVLVVPAKAFDDAAFCQQLTRFAEEANSDKVSAAEVLSRDKDMVIDCPRKTVRFEKSVAFSYAELGETWQASKQQEWNSVYCRNPQWAPIASGWKVTMIVHTFDGRRVEFFAECR